MHDLALAVTWQSSIQKRTDDTTLLYYHEEADVVVEKEFNTPNASIATSYRMPSCQLFIISVDLPTRMPIYRYRPRFSLCDLKYDQ